LIAFFHQSFLWRLFFIDFILIPVTTPQIIGLVVFQPARQGASMQRSAHGFTLVELVVATSILALVAVMGWRGLGALLQARDRLEQEMEQGRRTQLAFAQIETDCANLADMAELGERSVLAGEGARLVLVRTLADGSAPLRLQVVRYRLKGGTLLRAASAPTRDVGELDALLQRAGRDDGMTETALQTAVTALTIRAWNGERQAWRDGANVAADAPQGRPRVRAPETGLEVVMVGAGGTMRKLFLLGHW
jgi:general secretion pathway protein J